MKRSDLEAAIATNSSNRRDGAIDRLNVLAAKIREVWPKLTRVQKRVIVHLLQRKHVWVGYEPGDLCRPKTARALIKNGLAISIGFNEYSLYGPDTKLALNEYPEDE